MKTVLIHRNCQCFASVDVVKGICHKTKKPVAADGEACAQFAPAPKCGNCSNYRPDRENPINGTCGADKAGFFAYADMNAGTCKTYAK